MDPSTSTPEAAAIETPAVPRKWRSPQWLRSCLLIASMLVFFIVVAFILLFNIDLRNKGSSTHGGIVGSQTAPGVGFDLTPSYGTVAIRFHNGSTVNVAKIDADEDYQEMMRRFSVGGQKLDSMWQDNCGRMFDYSLDTLWKMLRKRFGLPSTKDVAHMSRLMAKLQTATGQYLGEPFPAAVIATPMFPTLCKDDVTEAAQLNRITAVSNPKVFTQPRELSAAFAGLGFGICANYTNTKACNAEEDGLPHIETLLVSLSNATLFARRYAMRRALTGYEPETSLLVNYDLGTDALPSMDDEPRKQEYWSRVEGRIIQLCLRDPGVPTRRPFDKVLLIGESAAPDADKVDLISTVQRALRYLQGDALPEFYADEPVYIAARGAAEFAKRAQETAGMVDDDDDDDGGGEGGEL